MHHNQENQLPCSNEAAEFSGFDERERNEPVQHSDEQPEQIFFFSDNELGDHSDQEGGVFETNDMEEAGYPSDDELNEIIEQNSDARLNISLDNDALRATAQCSVEPDYLNDEEVEESGLEEQWTPKETSDTSDEEQEDIDTNDGYSQDDTLDYNYGWVRDTHDHRDLYYSPPPNKIPKHHVDLRPQCPPVYDQGQLGSCTSNAVAGAFEIELIKQRASDFVPSRLFIWYNARALMGNNAVRKNIGVSVRNALKTLGGKGAESKFRKGVCPEPYWRYEPYGGYNKKTKYFNKGARAAMRPSKQAYSMALKHKITRYMRIRPNLNDMRSCLSQGYPFVFGFKVYPELHGDMIKKTGILDMPKRGAKPVAGHSVVAVGYDDAKRLFIIRNSWGEKWGPMGGYFMMPYSYLVSSHNGQQLAYDFWTIRYVV